MTTIYMVVTRERDYPEHVFDVKGFANREDAEKAADRASFSLNVIAEIRETHLK